MEEDNIFAEIPREGESLEATLDSVEKESQEETEEESTPAESQTEKEEPDLKQNNAWKELREAREEAEAKAQALEERLQALENEGRGEKSEFVTSLVGDNEDVAEKWEKERENLKEEVKRELIQDQLKAQQREQEEREHWAKWTDERLTEVEQEFKVNFKADESLKNELSKVMLDYSPTDEQGNLDYRKGMKLLTDMKKVQAQEEAQKTQVKKDIADATVSKETSVQQNKGFVTSNDIRGRDWRSLVNKD